MLRTLYCEASAPPEPSLEHCQLIGQCVEGKCVVLPKKFLHRWRSDLKVNSHFHPETVATFSQKYFCVPAATAEPTP